MRKGSVAAGFAVLFLDQFAYALLYPLLPLIVFYPETGILDHDPEDRKYFLIVFLFGVFAFSQILGSLYYGNQSDRMGRKRPMIVCLSASIAGYLLSALAIFVSSYPLLVLSRFLTGFFSAVLPIATAYLIDETKEIKTRGPLFQAISATLGLSWIFALVTGGLFLQNHFLIPLTSFFLLGAVTSLFNLLLCLFFFSSQKEKTRLSFSLEQFLNSLNKGTFSEAKPFYTSLFLWMIGFVIALQWGSSIGMENFHISRIEAIVLYLSKGVLWTIGSGLIGLFLSVRTSSLPLAIWGFLITGAFYFFAAASDFLLYFSIVFALTGLSASIAFGANIHLISTYSPEAKQGTAMGGAQATLSLSQLFGLLIGGIVGGVSTELLLYTSAFFSALAFLLLLARKYHVVKQ